MASWHARKLDRERHGPLYGQILDEIAERDGWTLEQFRRYQDRELTHLVRHAGRHVPYYRKAFRATGVDVEAFPGLSGLQQLPILEKESLRADPISLVDERLDVRRLLVIHTSGTTGTPLDLYRDPWANSAEYAYWEGRCRRPAGVRRFQDAEVAAGVQMVAAPTRTRPPFWVHNTRWHQLYMSIYHMSRATLPEYVRELRRFHGDYLEGYPSGVYAIARHILDNGLDPVAFKACFTTAETLLDYQREAIQAAFNCRIYDQYGCCEMAVFAAECELGSLHISPDYCIVEVLDDEDRPVEPGRVGHLICTGLLNKAQPVIRYRVGDMGAISAQPCSCGRGLPVLASIEGRTDDVVITSDGRRVGRLDHVFKGMTNVIEAQIVQEDYGQFRIRIVPAEGYSDADAQTAAANLNRRVGPAEVRVELVDRIERTRSGKFIAVVSKVDDKGRG